MNLQVVKLDPKEYGLDVEKASGIEKSFMPKIAESNALFEVYKNILTKEISKTVVTEAGDLRRKLVKVRTGISEIHKTEKAYYLAAGRFVDALKNRYTLPVEQMEEKLSEIEDYFEKIEAEKKKALRIERFAKLKPYTESEPLGLDTMSDEMFDIVLVGLKTNYEAKVKADHELEAARLETERLNKVEHERRFEFAPYVQFLSHSPVLREMSETDYVALLQTVKTAKAEHEAEQLRIKEDNERLRKESEAKEAEIKAIQAKAEKEKAEAEAKRQKEIEEERQQREKVESELRAKKEAEIKAESDRKDTELKAKLEADKLAKAPIKKQLNNWVDSFNLPKFSSENEKSKEIEVKFNSFKEWAKNEISKL